MVLEHVLLPVKAGQELAFEQAFAQAKHLIVASPGCGGVRLCREIENPGTYVLLVEWDQLSDHLEGFRKSPAYEQWRALLHHHYDPAPVVEHFEPVDSA